MDGATVYVLEEQGGDYEAPNELLGVYRTLESAQTANVGFWLPRAGEWVSTPSNCWAKLNEHGIAVAWISSMPLQD